MQKILLMLMFATLSLGAKAGEHHYIVEAKIYQEAALIGSPVLSLEPNTEAEMTIPGAFYLKLKVHPESTNTVFVSTELTVGDETLSPSMLLQLDKEAQMTIGDKSLALLVKQSDS